ncbi:sugar phosphate nucleotidyltransferase [Rhizobium beringeri]
MAQHNKVRKAVFPVAGLGTRFLPATKAVPKEMLTVVDKPIIQYVVDEAIEAGIEHLVFRHRTQQARHRRLFRHPFRSWSRRFASVPRRRKLPSSPSNCRRPAR